MTHADLITAASRWLRIVRRHSVVLSDVHSAATNEQPDVIAWRNTGFSTLVECKASRTDFRRDAKKRCRAEERGMGYERYFCAPDGMIPEAELPSGWGLIVPGRLPHSQMVVVVKSRAFMKRDERSERALLVNAVRRVTEGWGRRVFGEIAPELVDGDPHPTAFRVIRDLRAENAEMRRKLDAHRSVLVEERAACVRWLRDHAAAYRDPDDAKARRALEKKAGQIENGEHRASGENMKGERT